MIQYSSIQVTRAAMALSVVWMARFPEQSYWNYILYTWFRNSAIPKVVECVWNLMAHGDAREGKWRRNWRMEWVASTLHTTWEHGVSSITTADAHTSADGSRLNW